MKKSKYNIFIPYNDDKTIVFNPLYGTLGKIENEIYNDYLNNTLSKDNLDVMYDKHIFIDDDVDELAIINDGRAKGILDKTKKVYRIWTTSTCNARCYYCFEHGIEGTFMSTDTALKTANYIIDRINEGDKVRLEWFGGEPLLNTSVIRLITRMVKDKCNDVNAFLTASIITNGSLITDEVCKLFKECYIKRAQITLDGDKEVYNSAKNYYNKKDCNFDVIINNIKLLSNYDINTSIRINYDNKNYESIDRLIDFIYENFKDDKHVVPYIYPIWSSTKEEGYTSDAHADNNYLKLIDKLVGYNMMKPDSVIGIKRKVKQCAARNINSIAILPDGSISKCSETFTQIIGNLDRGIVDTEKYNEWTSIDIHDECRDCIYLPMCNDGCQSSRYTRMDSCFPTKDIIEDIIKWYVNYLDNKKKGVE